MALDFKKIIINSFLNLCETVPVKKIKITDLVAQTGISNQTFYNHFKSKSDLIHYIYRQLIVKAQPPAEERLVDLYGNMVFYYKNLLRYRPFILQMCRVEGDSNIQHCIESFELQWSKEYFQKFFSMDGATNVLKFAVDYDSYAFIGVTMQWIQHGMKGSPEAMALGRLKCLPVPLQPYFKEAPKVTPRAVDRSAFMTGEEPAAPPMPYAREKDAAVRVKTRFSNALLALCGEKPLSRITVNDLIEQANSGRQTFYRYFLDKDDLIQWTFRNHILHLRTDGQDYYSCWLEYYTRLYRYRSFLAQAGCMEGKNSLTEHMRACSVEWYRGLYYHYYGTLFLDVVISQCPQVNAVETVGVSHPRYGEVGVAFIEAADGAEKTKQRIEEFCKTHLAKFQVPKYYFYSDSAAWPRTGTGKITKTQLRVRAEQCIAALKEK